MLIGAVGLALLAFALAWPLPLLLAGAAWPSRAPATALVLWQAIALAGGLSMIGALLTFGLAPFGDDLVSSTAGLVSALRDGSFAGVEVLHLAVLTAGLILAGHLLLNLGLTILQTARQRQRHRALVDLLSSPMLDRDDARLLNSPAPVAYCLPGVLHSVTVFSAGLIRLLGTEELRGVIAHERAHASQRHDLVLVAFRAWHTSLPWFPVANRAEGAVATLTEMLADDQARAVVADSTLARAIVLVAAGGNTDGELPISSRTAAVAGSVVAPGIDALRLEARIRRLNGVTAPIAAVNRAAIIIGAWALLAVPTVLLIAPAIGSVAAI